MRIVSPYPPGGVTDTIGRALAQKLTETWGVQVIVDNRLGANGTMGATFVAKSPADGHTILVIPAGYAPNPLLYSKLPCDQARDLMPVSHLASGPLVRDGHAPGANREGHPVVHRAGQGQAWSHQLRRARHRRAAAPERRVVQPHGGGEDDAHTLIPYKEPATAIIDLMAGKIQANFINILQSLPLVKAGKLRGLGVTSPQRSPIAPDLPAIAEAGLPGFDMTNWYGMLVPTGTLRDRVNKLQREVNRILNLPELKERLANDGMTVVASTHEQFSTFLAKETDKFAKVIRAAGIKPQ